MAKRGTRDLIELWLVEPGELRAPFNLDAQALEYLPVDGPLPQVGDLLVLPPNVTGDSEEQTYAYGGTRTAFKVVEREHVYHRDRDEKLDPINPAPARYVKTVITVQRLTEKQFFEDRGWLSESAG